MVVAKVQVVYRRQRSLYIYITTKRDEITSSEYKYTTLESRHGWSEFGLSLALFQTKQTNNLAASKLASVPGTESRILNLLTLTY